MGPFAYRIMEDGGLEPIDDNPAINAAYEMNVVPMMCITNFTSTELGENLAHAVLGNLAVVERLLSNIIGIMRQKGYLGLNIDFENVLPETQNYNRFIPRRRPPASARLFRLQRPGAEGERGTGRIAV